MRGIRARAWFSLGCGLLWAVALSGCGTVPAASVDHPCGTVPAASVEHKGDPAPVDSGLVQSLQKQIKERDKRVAELESQLDTLKLIDHEMDEKRQSNRLPATLTHPEADRGR